MSLLTFLEQKTWNLHAEEEPSAELMHVHNYGDTSRWHTHPDAFTRGGHINRSHWYDGQYDLLNGSRWGDSIDIISILHTFLYVYTYTIRLQTLRVMYPSNNLAKRCLTSEWSDTFIQPLYPNTHKDYSHVSPLKITHPLLKGRVVCWVVKTRPSERFCSVRSHIIDFVDTVVWPIHPNCAPYRYDTCVKTECAGFMISQFFSLEATYQYRSSWQVKIRTRNGPMGAPFRLSNVVIWSAWNDNLNLQFTNFMFN